MTIAPDARYDQDMRYIREFIRLRALIERVGHKCGLTQADWDEISHAARVQMEGEFLELRERQGDL